MATVRPRCSHVSLKIIWSKRVRIFTQHITITRICNILQFFTAVKYGNFQIKSCDIFLNFAPNIDYGHKLEPPQRGSSNEYPQSMFYSRTKKKVYPCKPQFYYVKVGCQLHRCFSMNNTQLSCIVLQCLTDNFHFCSFLQNVRYMYSLCFSRKRFQLLPTTYGFMEN